MSPREDRLSELMARMAREHRCPMCTGSYVEPGPAHGPEHEDLAVACMPGERCSIECAACDGAVPA